MFNYGTFHNAPSGILNGSIGRIQVGDPIFNSLDTFLNEGNFTYSGTIELHGTSTNTGVMNLTGGTLDVSCGGNIENTGTLILGTVLQDCSLWDGDAGDGLWSNPANWSLDLLPTSNDTIRVGDESAIDSFVVHLDVNFEVGANRILENLGASNQQPTQGTLFIDPGVTLTITGAVENSRGHMVNNGVIVNNGTLENRGHRNINAAIFDNNGEITNNGTLDNSGSPSGSSTNVEQFGLFNNNGTLNNNGTVNNIDGTFTSSFAVIKNSGTINNRIDSVMVLECTEFTGNAVSGEPPTIILCSQPPTADAGPDQTGGTAVNEGDLITLNGSGSTDDGAIALYTWTCASSSSAIVTCAVIDGLLTNVVGPTFTAPEEIANYSFTVNLVVNDGGQNSPVDSVVIDVLANDDPPIANAGPNQTGGSAVAVKIAG